MSTEAVTPVVAAPKPTPATSTVANFKADVKNPNSIKEQIETAASIRAMTYGTHLHETEGKKLQIFNAQESVMNDELLAKGVAYHRCSYQAQSRGKDILSVCNENPIETTPLSTQLHSANPISEWGRTLGEQYGVSQWAPNGPRFDAILNKEPRLGPHLNSFRNVPKGMNTQE